MDNSKTGKFIAERRKLLVITQKELAEKLSVTDKAVSKWECGNAFPDTALLGRLSSVLKCSIAEIFDGESVSPEISSNKTPFRFLPDDSIPDFDVSDKVIELRSDGCEYVNPYLFGNNLEHTRASVCGGISAQMLKNRKFVGKPQTLCGCAEHWYPIGSKSHFYFSEPYTRHSEFYHMKRMLECNSQAMVNFNGGELCGIGQKELFFTNGCEYEVRLILMSSGKADVTASLTDSCGNIIDKSTFSVDSRNFCEYKVYLKSTKEIPDGRLEITFTDKCVLTLGAVSLMLKDNFCGMRKDVIERLKELGVTILRWPGGNFAGEYCWSDGLLPSDMRAPFESYLGLETQPRTMGYDFHEINTDDFIALCKEIGAEPYITINPVWNTPEESAKWVEYCNGDESTEYGGIRAERGFKEPYNVRFWSLGNEFGYGHMEGDNTPFGYCRTVSEHAKKMLEVSPFLDLCSSSPNPDPEWTDHAVKPLYPMSRIVSLHYYAAPPVYKYPYLEKYEYIKGINRIYRDAERILCKMRELLEGYSIKLSYDEWNTWYSWYRPENAYDGIFAAALLNMVISKAEKLGISLCCHFEAVNEGAITVNPDGTSRLSSMGKVMSVMKNHSEGKLLFADYEAVVTEKDVTVTVTIVNRSFDKNRKYILPAIGKVTLSKLYFSEELIPHTVLTESDFSYNKRENGIEATLPPHSFLHMEIKI